MDLLCAKCLLLLLFRLKNKNETLRSQTEHNWIQTKFGFVNQFTASRSKEKNRSTKIIFRSLKYFNNKKYISNAALESDRFLLV